MSGMGICMHMSLLVSIYLYWDSLYALINISIHIPRRTDSKSNIDICIHIGPALTGENDSRSSNDFCIHGIHTDIYNIYSYVQQHLQQKYNNRDKRVRH